MKQRVKNISYLAKAHIKLADLKERVYPALALPAGAEVLEVSLEVLEANTTPNTIDIGLKNPSGYESQKFMNDADISQKGYVKSEVSTEIKVASQVTLELANTSSTHTGEVVLRALYFCPSEIMTEFN